MSDSNDQFIASEKPKRKYYPLSQPYALGMCLILLVAYISKGGLAGLTDHTFTLLLGALLLSYAVIEYKILEIRDTELIITNPILRKRNVVDLRNVTSHTSEQSEGTKGAAMRGVKIECEDGTCHNLGGFSPSKGLEASHAIRLAIMQLPESHSETHSD